MFLSHHLIIIILLNYNYNMHAGGQRSSRYPRSLLGKSRYIMFHFFLSYVLRIVSL